MTDCDSCGGSPLDASKDQTEGESQLDSLLDGIDEINGADDRDGATDQDVVQICAQQQQIALQRHDPLPDQIKALESRTSLSFQRVKRLINDKAPVPTSLFQGLEVKILPTSMQNGRQ